MRGAQVRVKVVQGCPNRSHNRLKPFGGDRDICVEAGKAQEDYERLKVKRGQLLGGVPRRSNGVVSEANGGAGCESKVVTSAVAPRFSIEVA